MYFTCTDTTPPTDTPDSFIYQRRHSRLSAISPRRLVIVLLFYTPPKIHKRHSFSYYYYYYYCNGLWGLWVGMSQNRFTTMLLSGSALVHHRLRRHSSKLLRSKR